MAGLPQAPGIQVGRRGRTSCRTDSIAPARWGDAREEPETKAAWGLFCTQCGTVSPREPVLRGRAFHGSGELRSCGQQPRNHGRGRGTMARSNGAVASSRGTKVGTAGPRTHAPEARGGKRTAEADLASRLLKPTAKAAAHADHPRRSRSLSGARMPDPPTAHAAAHADHPRRSRSLSGARMLDHADHPRSSLRRPPTQQQIAERREDAGPRRPPTSTPQPTPEPPQRPSALPLRRR